MNVRPLGTRTFVLVPTLTGTILFFVFRQSSNGYKGGLKMQYFIFPLTISEAHTPTKVGYSYIKKNEGRLVNFPDLVEVNTYDRGTTRIIYEDVVYQIKKDYVDLSGKRRIYLVYPSEEGPEVIGDYDVFAEKFK